MSYKKDFKAKMIKRYCIENAKSSSELLQNQIVNQVINDFYNTNYKSTAARSRYLRAALNFIIYIVENTKVHKIENIKWYHVKEYAFYLLNKTKSNGEKLNYTYINTEINGVFYYLNLKKFNNPKLSRGAAALIREVKQNDRG